MRAWLVLGLLVSSFSLAESDRNHRNPAPPRRHAAAQTATAPVNEWLTNNFGFHKEQIDDLWGGHGEEGLSLASAMDEVATGDYDQMAKIVAEMMGTANPAIVEKAFVSARAEFLKRLSKKEDANAKREAGFFESLLFGFWAWPAKVENKRAFCGAVPAEAEKKAKEAGTEFKPENWSTGNDGLMAVYRGISGTEAIADDEKLSDEQEANLKKESAKLCYGGKYKPYEDFKGSFEDAANKVWEWNKQYHDDTAKLADARTSKNDKAAALRNIARNTSGKNLMAFNLQQLGSGWKNGKGEDLGKKAADLGFRVAAGIHSEFKETDPRVIEFQNQGGPWGKLSWKAGESASDAFEKLDFVKKARKAKEIPYFWPDKYERAFVADEPEAEADPAEAAQPDTSATTSATNPTNPPTPSKPTNPSQAAQTFNIRVADTKQAALVQKAQTACIDCHKASMEMGYENLPVTFTKDNLAFGVGTKQMLAEQFLGGKISQEEMTAFRDWLKTENIQAK